MIPVLAVPVLNRPDLLARMIASIDVEVGQLLVIDNGAGVADDVAPGAWHIRLPSNLGVATSWNLAIKATPRAPWWAIVNSDVEFAPGDLAALAEHVEVEPGVLFTLNGFSAFGLSAHVVGRVGLFDENYHPAYVEDCDYERRCALAGVPVRQLQAGLRHERSATIADPLYGNENSRTFPANHSYFERKWGGVIRGGERFDTPFDRGGSIAEWTLDMTRRAELAWR